MARMVAALETWPWSLQEFALIRCGFALDQRERKIAAEDDATFARKSVGEACRQRTDAGNRHAAKRDASEEDIEAMQAATQFA